MSTSPLDEQLLAEEVSADDTLSEVRSPARRQLFALAAATCGVTVATALFQPARADIVAKLSRFIDLDFTVLNFAFEMEELESDFFTRLPTSAGYAVLNEKSRSVLGFIAKQDTAHFKLLEAVRAQLGDRDYGQYDNPNASASRSPRSFRYPRLDTNEQVLKAALDIKENVLFAYHGAVGVVHSSDLLATAAAIAGTEGRHVAVLRELQGLDPVHAPFEGALTPQVSGRKLARYGFNGGGNR